MLGINQPAGDDQAGRGRDHRPGLRRGLGRTRSRPSGSTGKTVAVVGSGPGRAGRGPAADPGRAHGRRASSGPTASAACCATASPSSRWRSAVLDRRLAQMEAEGTRFRTGVDVGVDITGRAAARRATTRWCSRSARPSPRDLPVPGRELDGVYQAMEYLPPANRVGARRAGRRGQITADGQARRHHRRRRHRRRLPRHRAPAGRARRSPSWRSCRGRRTSGPSSQPWPTYPMIYRGLERARGGRRAGLRASTPSEFVGDERRHGSRALRAGRGRDASTAGSSRSTGTEREIPAAAGAAGDGLRRPGAGRACSSSSASSSTRAGNVARDERLHDDRAGRLRRRRRRPRAVADRVGDRRGPVRAPAASTPTSTGGDRSCRAPINPTDRPLAV